MGQQEKRSARRIPINCEVKLRFHDHSPSQYGTCTDLSVGGLTVRTSYVPQLDEVFDIVVMPPPVGGGSRTPFAATVKVRRCHEIERGKEYELGLEITQVLQ
ncbi:MULTISPECIES: PilZ domain-containing protein [Silvimonas]|uniref:PilZ domain-containing protein n=1 Tax=Silvimonas TaxID=300264 RepID=UPI0024B39DAC|nr:MULTISPECIES: PilZ domain-containing protein [Silvimonas]MDR3426454.1 PilZ domain-containing protein [Silvimonas sp.]